MGCIAGIVSQGNGVPATGVTDRFDAGNHIPHLTGGQLFPGNTNDLEDPDFLDLVDGIVGHELDAVSRFDGSLE